MNHDLFVITESMYVITNIVISLLCIMSCKHIIFKLKKLFNDVCCSVLFYILFILFIDET